MSDSTNETALIESFCPATQKQAALTLNVVQKQRRYRLLTGVPVDCNFRSCPQHRKIKCLLTALRITVQAP